MTINMPVQTLFIQSTSKVSLNSRFTQMMNKRKPSNEEFIRPTSKSERAVRYGTLLSDFHPTRDDRITAEPIQRNGRSLKSRLGKPNRSSSSPAKRYSFWDNDKYEKRTSGNFARTMKRTSERGWSGRPWTSRFRKNRDGANQGHPLDPLNYNSERQLIFSKKRTFNPRRTYRPNRSTFGSYRRKPYNFGRGYRGGGNTNNTIYRRNERNLQSKLDSDLQNYFSKSSNFAKRQLDDEIDVYMMNTKHYLDKSIDEYMKAKKNFIKVSSKSRQ